MSTQKICQLEIVYDGLLGSLSILLLAVIGAKLIRPYSGLEIDSDDRAWVTLCGMTLYRKLTLTLLVKIGTFSHMPLFKGLLQIGPFLMSYIAFLELSHIDFCFFLMFLFLKKLHLRVCDCYFFFRDFRQPVA